MSSTRLSFLLSTARSTWNSQRLSTTSWWEPVGKGWATGFVLFFIFLWQLLNKLSLLRRRPSPATPSASPPLASSSSPSTPGVSAIISDSDLGDLIVELEGKNRVDELWEDVIEKKNDSISYNAKCCRQKDGSIKYLSITCFEGCSTELLRDFYMDNEYRKKWDKTVVDHKQLEVDEINNLEFGQTIKKFPLLTPREYVLVWRLWEGRDKSYYCLIKDCEHPQVTRQKKYVRVGFFRSGWHIKKVPGRDACEITMVHQEDAGLNVEMAKLAFAKGIWNYVCKMDAALRPYSSWSLANSSPQSSLKLVPVPHVFEADVEDTANVVSDRVLTSREECQGTLSPVPRKSWVGKGLLLLGGVVCLSRGHSTLATQLAVACILKKLANGRQEPKQDTERSTEAPTGRWSPRTNNSKFQRSFSSKAGPLSPSRSQTKR